MKIRLVVPLVGLAIGFALPTFAQEKEEANPFLYRAILASPQLAQQLEVINRQLDEAFNKHDAVAVAALFTTNATLVAPLGIVSGRRRWILTTRDVERLKAFMIHPVVSYILYA